MQQDASRPDVQGPSTFSVLALRTNFDDAMALDRTPTDYDRTFSGELPTWSPHRLSDSTPWEEEDFEGIAEGKEEDEDLSRQYCILRTILEMLQDRGFAVDSVLPMERFADMPRRTRSLFNGTIFHHKCLDRHIRVHWRMDDEGPIRDEATVQDLRSTDITRCIIVTKEPLSGSLLGRIADVLCVPVEHWLEEELVFNHVRRSDCPLIEVVRQFEFKRAKHMFRSMKLPTLREDSQLGRYYGLYPGEVVRCLFPSLHEPGRSHTIYKYLSPSSGKYGYS